MRSDLVFGAITHLPNRFLLTQLASKAVRKLHRPGTRMQDTANCVFAHLSFSNPLRERQVECSNLSIVCPCVLLEIRAELVRHPD